MDLNLDIRTLFAALAVVLFFLAAALSFITLTQKTYPGFKRWTLGAVAMALGYLLSTLRGPIPAGFSIMVGNTLYIVGAAYTLAGIRRFLGLKPCFKYQATVTLLGAAGMAWFLWGHEFIGMRGMVLGLAVALFLFPSGWLLATHPAKGHRALYVGTGLFLMLFCVVMMVRAVGMVAQGYQFDLFGQSPLQAGFFLFMIATQLSWIIGLLLMNSQRLGDDLAQSQARLSVVAENQRRILDFLPEPTWVVDHQGRVTHWNLAMERITGVAAGDILGKGDYQHSLPLYGEGRPCLIDLALHQDSIWEAHYGNLERLGETLVASEAFLPGLGEDGRYMACSAAPLLDPQGRVSGAVEVMRDITESRLAQQERERLIRDLTAALDKVRTLKGLIPICSHCKSIRRDEGYWQQLEAFFADHAEVEFSHGICPDCRKKYYHDIPPPD